MSVDLHTHTTHSDGTYSPSDLVTLAKLKNLTAIAITDHDIVSGNREAISTGNETGINVVPGVELSVDYPLPLQGHLHLLGLFIDSDNKLLNESLQIIRQARTERNYKILRKLTELGKKVTVDELVTEAGEGTVGRPHIAGVMVKKGYVSTLAEAFQLYLKNGAPAYFDRKRLPVNQAIDLVHSAGGITVLAHPTSLGFSSLQEAFNYILQLKKIGLDGIEAYCYNQSKSWKNNMIAFARDSRMVVSGGSDFHGDIKPNQLLGSLDVPDKVYHDLISYHKKIK